MMDTSKPERIISIDVLRGLTILIMIFVNDVAGVTGIPAWMKHIEPPEADGMTFVDVVFPAFLFIVGMSIPFALGKRLQNGESWLRMESQILGLDVTYLSGNSSYLEPSVGRNESLAEV
jgi:heparan-alpha-glucosaminide N-acetyltransferase